MSGDDACWLNRVCDECGALTEGAAHNCWRCGRPLTKERDVNAALDATTGD